MDLNKFWVLNSISAPQCHRSRPGSNAAGAVRLLQQEMEGQRIVCAVARLIKTELISQLGVPARAGIQEERGGRWVFSRGVRDATSCPYVVLALSVSCTQVVGLVSRCFSSRICGWCRGGTEGKHIHPNTLPPEYQHVGSAVLFRDIVVVSCCARLTFKTPLCIVTLQLA